MTSCAQLSSQDPGATVTGSRPGTRTRVYQRQRTWLLSPPPLAVVSSWSRDLAPIPDPFAHDFEAGRVFTARLPERPGGFGRGHRQAQRGLAGARAVWRRSSHHELSHASFSSDHRPKTRGHHY